MTPARTARAPARTSAGPGPLPSSQSSATLTSCSRGPGAVARQEHHQARASRESSDLLHLPASSPGAHGRGEAGRGATALLPPGLPSSVYLAQSQCCPPPGAGSPWSLGPQAARGQGPDTLAMAVGH